MHSFIIRIQGEKSELTFSPSFNKTPHPEVCYGDSEEIVQILDMTINK